jgi:hypothetical protein
MRWCAVCWSDASPTPNAQARPRRSTASPTATKTRPTVAVRLKPHRRSSASPRRRGGVTSKANEEPADAALAEAAILLALSNYPSDRPPTPRALQDSANEGGPPEIMSTAFWRLVARGTLVFDGNAKVKLNDIPPRI